MTKVTMSAGALLIAVGVIAYIATQAASWTALIPSFFGLLLLIFGLLSRNPSLRQHTIHAALVIAVLGALGSLMNVIKLPSLLQGTAERPGAIVASVALFVVCVVYVIIGVRSFIAARKSRATP